MSQKEEKKLQETASNSKTLKIQASEEDELNAFGDVFEEFVRQEMPHLNIIGKSYRKKMRKGKSNATSYDLNESQKEQKNLQETASNSKTLKIQASEEDELNAFGDVFEEFVRQEMPHLNIIGKSNRKKKRKGKSNATSYDLNEKKEQVKGLEWKTAIKEVFDSSSEKMSMLQKEHKDVNFDQKPLKTEYFLSDHSSNSFDNAFVKIPQHESDLKVVGKLKGRNKIGAKSNISWNYLKPDQNNKSCVEVPEWDKVFKRILGTNSKTQEQREHSYKEQFSSVQKSSAQKQMRQVEDKHCKNETISEKCVKTEEQFSPLQKSSAQKQMRQVDDKHYKNEKISEKGAKTKKSSARKQMRQVDNKHCKNEKISEKCAKTEEQFSPLQKSSAQKQMRQVDDKHYKNEKMSEKCAETEMSKERKEVLNLFAKSRSFTLECPYNYNDFFGAGINIFKSGENVSAPWQNIHPDIKAVLVKSDQKSEDNYPDLQTSITSEKPVKNVKSNQYCRPSRKDRKMQDNYPDLQTSITSEKPVKNVKSKQYSRPSQKDRKMQINQGKKSAEIFSHSSFSKNIFRSGNVLSAQSLDDVNKSLRYAERPPELVDNVEEKMQKMKLCPKTYSPPPPPPPSPVTSDEDVWDADIYF